MTRTLTLATTNPGKVQDWSALLARVGWTAHPMDTPQVDETGTTPLDNARLKVRGVEAAGGWVLGDDVALHVDALDGEPGLHLKRWAMSIGGWRAAREALGQLDGSRARFVIGVAVAEGARLIAETEVEVVGVVRRCADLDEGPGVEPCFVPLDADGSLSRLEGQARDTHHYRNRAWAALLPQLRSATGEEGP